MPWRYEYTGPGTATYTLDSWRDFDQFLDKEMVEYPEMIYRGQAKAEWKLQSSLDRLYERLGGEWEDSRSTHLKNFKFASRGRRGINPPTLATENDWWALGQHQGLATPLLDWTSSPFVAAYFAFFEIHPPGVRAVFALDQEAIDESSKRTRDNYHSGKPSILEFFRPLSDENSRLVSQAGLFTRGPDGIDLESWVNEQFDDQSARPVDDQDQALSKIVIPDRGLRDRDEFLRFLDRMNINHLSLFPDLSGACHFSNYQLMVERP